MFFFFFPFMISSHVLASLSEVFSAKKLNINTPCLTECCQTLLNHSRPPMNYSYYQDTGHFIGGLDEAFIDTFAYSGMGPGYMNPSMQCVSNTGPLPAALYKLASCQNTMHNPPVKRPCSFYLEPQEPEKMCGRGDFLVHGCQCCTEGDLSVPPVGGCSEGCIVMEFSNRLKLRVGDFVQVFNYEKKDFAE